jgi:hypothetical protein
MQVSFVSIRGVTVRRVIVLRVLSLSIRGVVIRRHPSIWCACRGSQGRAIQGSVRYAIRGTPCHAIRGIVRSALRGAPCYAVPSTPHRAIRGLVRHAIRGSHCCTNRGAALPVQRRPDGRAGAICSAYLAMSFIWDSAINHDITKVMGE